ncbi:hypothetical protein V0U79_06070 [Hyphobacterium sp. HN65]|uniref:Uncharacterized protein n=1 Tax=Hyphobacterium lacteum TaxID=3116575 RepID=A0ABU7LPT2_9PROT|nr:hypothetical protein [Hyphobacterium sp. HN65]MEE2525925.1 hypothetical protein [Hyphobacterium sp. HN65]
MILARLSHAFRTQNWFAVAVEFLIVIAGVVIGFQIQGWNETRQGQARVAQALERLQQETEQNISGLRARNESNEERLAEQALMVRVAMSGELAPEDAETFERAVAQLMYFSAPPIQEGSYRALEQSGDLTLIDNQELISALNYYQGAVIWIENQHGSFRRGLTTFTDTLNEFVFHEPTDDPMVTRARVDLDRLAEDPRRQSALVQMARMHAIFGQYIHWLEGETVELCERLAQETGQPCEVPE